MSIATSRIQAPRSRMSLLDRLAALAERHPVMQQMNRLSSVSDAELVARGLTREGEMRRILGSRFHI